MSDDQLRGRILFAFKRSEGSKVGAARMLGLDRITLGRRIKRLGMLRFNPSLHPTCYSGLRPLPQAGELKRLALFAAPG